MVGRKPKPTRQKIAEGDARQRGKRKLEAKLKAEPKAARGLPSCPAHVKDPRARRAWKFWAEELASMNLDHRPDAMMLEGACVSYARAVHAELEAARLGEVIEIPILSGAVDMETGWFKIIGYKQKKNVWVSICERSWMLVARFCTEFGLSPVSRTRLSIERKDESEADLMAILSAPRKSLPAETVQ